jgi:hypothetical protein
MPADLPSVDAPRWTRSHKLIGLFALFVWLHTVFLLYPLPPDHAAQLLPDAPAGDVLPGLWRTWIEGLVLFALGIFVSVMAYRNIRYWKPAILLTSGFLVFENLIAIVADILSRGSLSYWFDLWITVTGNMIDRGQTGSALATLYHLFLWPAYHLFLVGAVIVVWLSQRRDLRSNQEHVA